MTILNRYIIKEFLPKFFTSLLVLTFILLMDRLFDLADLLLNKGAGIVSTTKLFLYILPSLFMFTVPMSILSGTILLFSRMNEDGEITAIRVAGVSPLSIMRPVILASILISLIMLHFNSTVAPTSSYKFKTLYYQILYKNPLLQFSEKNFIQIQNYDIYIKKITDDGTLKDVVIYKWEEGFPTVTTAQTASIAIAEDKGILFRLNNGKIFQENYKRAGEFNVCSFLNNEMLLQLSQGSELLNRTEGGARQLTSKVILEKIKSLPDEAKNFYLTEYHLRWAIGCAGFLFVFIATPVSMLVKKRAKSFGIATMFGVIFIYYILLAIATTLGEKNFVNPLIAVWLPNLVVGITGTVLTVKVTRN